MKKLSFLKEQIEIDTLLKDRKANLVVKSALILIGISWLGLPFFWHKLPPEIPIFYSRPWGDEQLIARPFILLLPGLATVFSLINLKLAGIFFSSEKALTYFLVWFNLIVTLLAVITFWRILFIVT